MNYRDELTYNLESLLSEHGIAYSRISRYRLRANGMTLSHNGEDWVADGETYASIFDLLVAVAYKDEVAR